MNQEDGSETDARTAATQTDVRGVISSPARTMTFPRGIFVKTLSTPREASSLRCAVMVELNVRLGRSDAARNAATSARSASRSGVSERRIDTSDFVSEPYSTAAGESRLRCSRPVEVSRRRMPPFCSTKISRLSTIPLR